MSHIWSGVVTPSLSGHSISWPHQNGDEKMNCQFIDLPPQVKMESSTSSSLPRLSPAVLSSSPQHFLPTDACAARQRHAQLAVRRLDITVDGLGEILDSLCKLTLTTLTSDSSSTCSSGTSSS